MNRIIITFTIFMLMFLLVNENNYIYTQKKNFKIYIEIKKIRNNIGFVQIALFNDKNKSAFPSNHKKAFKKMKYKIKKEKVNLVITNVPKGIYAISVHHDENKNGKLDTNVIGIPY